MTRVLSPALVALFVLASGCARRDAGEPSREPSTPVAAEVDPAPSEPPRPEPPSLRLDQFIASTVSKAQGIVFIANGDPENQYSCKGFSFCKLQCLDGGIVGACSEATYRVACGRDPVYPIPYREAQSRPVRCTAGGDRCSVDHVGVHAPGYPVPRFRDTFYFDSTGNMIGFSRCADGGTCPVDPEALHRRAKAICAARAALEGGALAPVERLGLYSSACADLGGQQRRDHEQHLCGSGVFALVREMVQDVVDEGGFDGCVPGEGSLFRCWVYGTEARTVYHFDNVGTESAPRFAPFAVVTEGRALDEDAVEAQAARVDAFLDRVRSGAPRQVGRVLTIPNVRPCR